ncbi:unnamed protein product [Peniophora sp. CBMAI 1063]|nr:unnamed protein product [Peniophora sp. CBMAI 1063]
MENRRTSNRTSNRNTVPGLRQIDLATVRAQYVREHKTGAVGGDHMAETQFQVRHMKISKPRPLPTSKSPRSPRQRTHSKLHKPRPPQLMPSSPQRDPDEPPPTLPPLFLGDGHDPEPAFPTSPHSAQHPDLDQDEDDEPLTSFRDRRAGVILQMGSPSAFRETTPGDLARALFEARIARRKSYLGHPDYYIPRSVKTRASVVSQAPSTARMKALETSTDSIPPLPELFARASTSTIPSVDEAVDGDDTPQLPPPATHPFAPLKRALSDVVKTKSPRSRISSLLNPISRAPRRVLVEEVDDEGTPPAPPTSLPTNTSLEPTREASPCPSDDVVAGVASLRLSDASASTPSLDQFVDAESYHEKEEGEQDKQADDPPPPPPTRVFVAPMPLAAWHASRSTISRMSTVLEEPSPVPASIHLPSSHSASTTSSEHSLSTHEQPSGDGPDTSGTSLSAHAQTPLKAAENLPFVPRRLSRASSLVIVQGEKPLPTPPGVSPINSADRMYWVSAGGMTAARSLRPQTQGGRKLVRKRAQHALHLETDADEDLRTFRLQLAARPEDEPAGWYRRDGDKPPLSVTSFGSLLGVRFRNDCRIDFGNDGRPGESRVSPTIYEYIS